MPVNPQSLPEPTPVERLVQFLDASSWEEKKELAQIHLDDLVSTEALAAFQKLLEYYRDDAETQQDMENQWGLLARCSSQGVDAAFEAWLCEYPDLPWTGPRILIYLVAFLLSPTWIESRQEVESHPVLRSEAVEPILERMEDLYRTQESDADFLRLVAQGRVALAEVRGQGIEAAFAARVAWSTQIIELLQADNENDLQAVVEQHPELASDEALNEIADFQLRALKRGAQNLAVALRERRDWIITERQLSAQLTMATAFVHRSISGSTGRIRVTPAVHPDSENVSSLKSTLEMALEMCERMLAECPAEQHPILHARICRLKGDAYYQLSIVSERVANLERALECYQTALNLLDTAQPTKHWADTQQNLGNTYLNRALGNRLENLRAASQAYQHASTYYSRENHPRDWGSLQYQLGVLDLERVRAGADPAENVDRAIAYFESALQVRTDWTEAEARARTEKSLADAYLERVTGEREENIEIALTYLWNALQVRTREEYPIEWALTQNVLGNALAARLRDDPSENVTQAVRAYQQASSVLTRAAAPADHRMIQGNLGRLYFAEQRWAEAVEAFTAALAATESLYLQSATSVARQAELARNQSLVVGLAYSLARLGQDAEAMTICEQGKARGLAETLERTQAALQQATPDDREAFEAARQNLTELEQQARLAAAEGLQFFVTVTEQLEAARRNLAAAASRIRQYAPDFMPVGFNFDEIAKVAARLDQPLVYLLTTEQGSLALIVYPDSAMSSEALWLDSFTIITLADLLNDQEAEGGDRAGYLRAMVEGDVAGLTIVLDEAWTLLRDGLGRTLTRYLVDQGWRQAILLPMGILGVLPLHAVLLDDLVITCAPAARTLQTTLHEQDQRVKLDEPRLLAVGNPLPALQPLPFARLEVEVVQTQFKSGLGPFLETEARRDAVLTATSSATHLHLACHGQFNSTRPLDSALLFAGGDYLLLRDVLDQAARFSTIRLVVLSACQSGVIEFAQVPDEAIGFPAGFLQAGVPGVISTLWSVSDLSTALLIIRFYQAHIHEKLPPAAALRVAQFWLRSLTNANIAETLNQYRAMLADAAAHAIINEQLRRYALSDPDETPFSHPYYWAPFVYHGV